MNREMQRALEADGEKLRALTGDDHGPVFLSEPTDRGLFCPKCGERDKLAPNAEYWSADHDGKDRITSFHPGPGREGMKLTGKTECRNCNHVF